MSERDGGADQHGGGSGGEGLSADDVRKVAALARLELSEEQVELYRGQLDAVLGYVERLRDLNLDGVDPMTHVVGEAGEAGNRLDLDQPRQPLLNEALMRMAPEKVQPFLRVPRVLGEG
jgi:aspartyl-tRNA(Asn)/glutamyl-tRNA(Gln) amidotransferase subunit C